MCSIPFPLGAKQITETPQMPREKECHRGTSGVPGKPPHPAPSTGRLYFTGFKSQPFTSNVTLRELLNLPSLL